MKFLKQNLVELFLLAGIALVSTGFFIWSTIAGLIVTGIMSIGVAFLVFKGGG